MSAEKVLSEIRTRSGSSPGAGTVTSTRFPPKHAYRHFLCPLWAGASGHTGGALMFWAATTGRHAADHRNQRWPPACSLCLAALLRQAASGPITRWPETFDDMGEPLADNPQKLDDRQGRPSEKRPDGRCLPPLSRNVGRSANRRPQKKLDESERTARSREHVRQAIHQTSRLTSTTSAAQLSVQFTVAVWSWSRTATQGLATTSFLNRPLASTLSPAVLERTGSAAVRTTSIRRSRRSHRRTGDQTKKDGNQ